MSHRDRLIGVKSLNLACEGLLLGMQAGGITPKASSITACINLH
jgi:hypothetical protein